MRALPDLENAEAMAEIGRRSALGRARNDAAESLRDACTFCQSADWAELRKHAEDARASAERLMTLAAMWESL